MNSAVGCSTVELILAEEARLRRLAFSLVRRAADADDLVQDTLLRAFRARDRFSPGTSIRAWTSTILRNVFVTGMVRTRRRALETDTDAGAPLERTKAPAPTSDAEPGLDALLEKLDDQVKAALQRVPDHYRTPFLLAVVDGLTCAEIAERMRVPVGTVMSRIHRARERLKRELVYDGAAVRTRRRGGFVPRATRPPVRPDRRPHAVPRP